MPLQPAREPPMASKRRIRRKTCGGKKRYFGAGAAWHAARSARVKSNGDDIHHYCCPNCGGWHIGHRSARKVL